MGNRKFYVCNEKHKIKLCDIVLTYLSSPLLIHNFTENKYFFSDIEENTRNRIKLMSLKTFCFIFS